MSLRKDKKAMAEYHRAYHKRRSIPVDQRKLIALAVEAAFEKDVCCYSCRMLRQLGDQWPKEHA